MEGGATPCHGRIHGQDPLGECGQHVIVQPRARDRPLRRIPSLGEKGADPALRAEWQRNFKLENDPRIVPGIGRFLRRFSLDELPQLWQVVAGSLSLVGPRPFPRYHLEHYDHAVLELRRRVRPGVTGLWQVKVRSNGDLDLQQSHDAYYIRNWSLWMDFYVLARTAGAVLAGRGAS